MTLNASGTFYNKLSEKREDSADLKSCIEKTVTKLLGSETDLKKPGILLGKIQSGKTRAFLGVIALAFDNGYDIAIILTKGTKPLTEQTLKRLNNDFKDFISEKLLQVHDIMSFPGNLTKYELDQKMVIVAKKQIDNLRHVLDAITTKYPELKGKKVIIIDDEADFAGLSFHKNKETGNAEQGTLANKIDEIRTNASKSDFLQVTATPYSLYLQPDNLDGESMVFLPKKPAFTEILPEYKDYRGGDYYFLESENEESPASCLYEELPDKEVELLKAKKKLGRADRRSFKIEDVFNAEGLPMLRRAIMNFIVGGCLRRIQQEKLGIKKEDYAFLLHTDIARITHSWQEEIVNRLSGELIEISQKNENLLNEMVKESYNDLIRSINLTRSFHTINDLPVPTIDETISAVKDALAREMLLVQKVNSDEDVKFLLDDSGQLKLRTPLNIFIGGQILDRGITIKNMISFYYGRNPKRFQQDTVLQHSRMYGARTKEDLGVTRFYTTKNIYEIMRCIHEFDSALRAAFLKGEHDNGVYFIRKDENDKLVPCSPNKIMLSNIITLKPHKRLLPVGFQTDYKTKIKKDIENIDMKINSLKQNGDFENPFLISLSTAIEIIDLISKTLLFDGKNWDPKSHKACIEHLSKNTKNTSQVGNVWCLVRKDRNISRFKQDGSFSDGPYGTKTEGAIAAKVAIDIPMLMLFRQNGHKIDGWKDQPFWWPVITAPENTQTSIFADEK